MKWWRHQVRTLAVQRPLPVLNTTARPANAKDTTFSWHGGSWFFLGRTALASHQSRNLPLYCAERAQSDPQIKLTSQCSKPTNVHIAVLSRNAGGKGMFGVGRRIVDFARDRTALRPEPAGFARSEARRSRTSAVAILEVPLVHAFEQTGAGVDCCRAMVPGRPRGR